MIRELLSGTDHEQSEIAVEDVLDIVANQRRRRVIMLVDDHDAIEMGELTERIAAMENGDEFVDADYKAAYVSLYQSHSEKFEDTGIIDIDGDVYRRTELTESVAQFIRDMEDRFAGDAW